MSLKLYVKFIIIYNIFIKGLKLKFIIILLFIIINIKIYFNNYNNLYSQKWIVMTAFNSPNISILKLLNNLKILNTWKIIINSNNKNIDHIRKKLKFKNELVYLSIKEQKYLRYNIIKYLNNNILTRKNIGYLYAIQH